MSSRFLNLDTDNTLGGVNTSDSRVASQKAVKDYVDTNVPTVTSIYTPSGTDAVNGVAVSNAIATKQDILVSGTSIKTLNGNSLLGSGNIVIEASSTPDVDGDTISYNTDNELQTIGVINQRDGSALKIWHGTQAQWNQGESIPWYYWQTSATITNYRIDNGLNYTSWYKIAYGNGVFLAVGWEKLARSIDGETWVELTPPFSGVGKWSIDYGNGRFVIISKAGSAYSTDNGDSWTEVTDSRFANGNNATYTQVCFTGGKFIALSDNFYNTVALSKILYSDDGAVWNESNTFSGDCTSVASDGNIYVMISGTTSILYSYDLINWTSKTLTPAYSNLFCTIVYGNGVFVITTRTTQSRATQFMYSTNGIDWNNTTTIFTRTASSYAIAFGSSIFLASVTQSSGDMVLVSDDGISWSIQETLTSKDNSYWNKCYGNGKFITNVQGSRYFYINANNSISCFTDTATPTTTSTIYSAPDTASTLTVSSVTSGAITLSDNNTYYYNQSGNQYTYSTVGEAHSDWLCFIDGVGIKIGTTTIANNLAVTVDQTYNATSTNAQSGVAVASGISDTLGTINTSLESIIAQGD